MLYSKLCDFLQRLENTSKRLEITDILSELISECEASELDKAMYLSLGYLKAPFASEKFNIADKMMRKILESALVETTNVSPTNLADIHKNISEEIQEQYRITGDLGSVAYELKKMTESKNLSITEVHEKMLEIAQTEGTGSQEVKINKTVALLKQLNRLETKFSIRIILGTTRLGFTEITIADALAKFLSNKKDPTLKKDIEKTYNIHPDIGLIARTVKEQGIEGLKEISIETGVPVLAQKAQRIANPDETINKMGGRVWAEFKFDGTRVQLHLDRHKEDPKKARQKQASLLEDEEVIFLVKTFTRNLEETTHQYPDIIAAANKQVMAESVILDGEAIGYNKETGAFLPFQETIQRKRKHGIKESAENIPLRYYVFDLLYLNGESLIELPLHLRREKLKEVILQGDTLIIDDHIETDNPDTLAEYFDTAMDKKLEGLVVKNQNDPYQAGARSFSWIKLKGADKKLLDDSVDVVVLGYYFGKGERSKFGIGGFLAGVYDEDEDTFKTVTKVGSGLSDEEWVKLKNLCDQYRIKDIPANVVMDKIYKPDVIVSPKLVVEVGADEVSKSPTHTAGYALRFPRLLNFRSDKNPTEATTVSEVAGMKK